jgi:hypothetical protein
MLCFAYHTAIAAADFVYICVAGVIGFDRHFLTRRVLPPTHATCQLSMAMINFLAEINKSHRVLRGISDTCGLIRTQIVPSPALLDPLKPRVETEVDSFRHADLQQPVANGFVIFTQDRVGAVYDRHMDAELAEDAGELIGNIAATGDHHALGQPV